MTEINNWHAVMRDDFLNVALFVRKYGVNQHDKLGNTALAVAVLTANLELVEMLLDMGADPNLPCKGDGATPLSHAIDMDDLDLVKLLLSRGADESALQTKSILHEACLQAADEVLNWLISNGYDVNTPDEKGMYPINRALGIPSTIDILLNAGADINTPNPQGDTPLFDYIRQASKFMPGYITYFHGKGANINTQNNNGDTPLHVAIMCLRYEEAIDLIKLGADPTIKNNSSKTALSIAKELQKERGADWGIPHLNKIIEMLSQLENTQ